MADLDQKLNLELKTADPVSAGDVNAPALSLPEVTDTIAPESLLPFPKAHGEELIEMSAANFCSSVCRANLISQTAARALLAFLVGIVFLLDKGGNFMWWIFISFADLNLFSPLCGGKKKYYYDKNKDTVSVPAHVLHVTNKWLPWMNVVAVLGYGAAMVLSVYCWFNGAFTTITIVFAMVMLELILYFVSGTPMKYLKRRVEAGTSDTGSDAWIEFEL